MSDADYNLDSSRAFTEVLLAVGGSTALLNSKGQLLKTSGVEDYFTNSVMSISRKELNTIFRRSYLLRKVVSMLPNSAKSAGYIVKDATNKVIEKSNLHIIQALEDGALMGRLYGKVFMILESEDNDLTVPLTQLETISGHRIKFDLERRGDYFFDKNDERVAHKSKVYIFTGSRSYKEDSTIDDDDYAESILIGLLISIKDYLISTQIGRKILKNLSNLTLGMKGLGMKLNSNNGKVQVKERLISFDLNRNVDEAIGYDLENEKIEYISQSLAQVPEFLEELKLLFVSNTEYPYDKLFSSGTKSGLSSGYQNQLITRFQWAEQVKVWSELNYLPHLNRLYKTLSPNSDSINIEIPLPLTMTDLEKAEIEEKTANKLIGLVGANIININEARNSYRSDNLTLDVILSDEDTLHPRLVTEPKDKTPDAEIENVDAMISNQFWDVLANITLYDLDVIAEEVLETV
jgi:hypothetical protein